MPNSAYRPGRKIQLRLYFVLALGGTWLLQLPAVLAQRGLLPGGAQTYMLPAALGGFCPLVAALIATHREAGSAAVRRLLGSVWRGGLAPYWYLLGFFLFPAIYVLGAAVYRAVTHDPAVAWLYLPETAQHVVALVLVPLAEEPGWRGFALPRLQRRFGALEASVLLGVAWAAWHVMMFAFSDPSPGMFATSMLNIFAGSIVFTWLYNRTRGSLLVAILAHAGAHFNNPGHAQAGNVRPLFIYTLAVAAVGVLLIVFDRAAWQRSTLPLTRPIANE